MHKSFTPVKKYFLLILLIIPAFYAEAQDPHFTQYFASPSTMNPALTGFENSDWKLTAIYRNQWWGGNISPYITSGISVEKSLAPMKDKNHQWGFGFSMLSDASNGGLLKNNYFNAGVAYQMDLSGDGSQTLGLGTSVAYANRLLDASKFAFQDQFGSMGFQRAVPTADPVSLQNNHYWDLNAGVYYDNMGEKWGYGFGAAVFHSASPSGGFYDNSSYRLARRIVLHGNGSYQFNSGDNLVLSGISEWQGKNNIFTIGAQYGIHVQSEIVQQLHVGLYERFHDALCPYVGLEAKNWLLGISYDFVSSHVSSPYNAVQSLEFSFGWLLGEKNKSGNKRILHY